MRVENVTQFSVAPGPTYRFATFTPEKKGKPAKVAIWSYPNLTTPVTGKSFYQAEEMTTNWAPSGNSCIVFTSTTVDTSGKSYYGSTALHLLSADGSSDDYSVPLPKDGPVYDVKWCPDSNKAFFVVLSGMMPAQACLYNAKCEQLFLFGEAARNTISFAPSGRFMMLGGFGNLAGGMDFWDLNKKKKMGSNQANIPVGYDWSADSRYFIVSTTAPRMNVENGIQVFKYNGTGPVGNIAFEAGPVLFECVVKPAAFGTCASEASGEKRSEWRRASEHQPDASRDFPASRSFTHPSLVPLPSQVRSPTDLRARSAAERPLLPFRRRR